MKQILVQYTLDTFPYDTRTKILSVPDNVCTWRELQQFFDPGYHHNNLKFWPLGSTVPFEKE